MTNENKTNKQILAENVKGIKRLTILKEELEKFKESKFIGIYGPNGSGKSSFKEALWKPQDKIIKHFDHNKKSVQINKDIKIEGQFAIFDEIMVRLITTSSSSVAVNILGDEVKTLYNLLVNQKNILKEKESTNNILGETLFEIDNKIFDTVISTLNEIIYFVEKIEKGKEITKEQKEFNNVVLQSIKGKIGQINSHIGGRNIQTNSPNPMMDFIPSWAKSFFAMENEAKNRGIASENIENITKDLSNFQDFFKEIYFICENFGYIKLESQLDNILDGNFASYFQDRNQFIVPSTGDKIKKFIDWIENTDNKKQFESAWTEIKTKVDKVIKLANDLLIVYNMSYLIDLRPTTTKDTYGNFSLKYKHSTKELSQKEFEETLSYGELNIISLALFIASCITRGIKEETTFIFDDPVSSYDLNRVQISIQMIKSLISEEEYVKKIYFLSHEKHFINSLSFPFGEDITFWEMQKNQETELILVDDMKSDWNFYAGHVNNKDPIIKAITRRYFVKQFNLLQCMKFIKEREKNMQKIKMKKFNDVLHPSSYDIQKGRKPIKFDHLKFKKEDFLKLRDEIKLNCGAEFFSKTLEAKRKDIIKKMKKNEEISAKESAIFRASMYRTTLNAIAHENKDTSNLDISRAYEIASILYSSREQMLDDFNTAIDDLCPEEAS